MKILHLVLFIAIIFSISCIRNLEPSPEKPKVDSLKVGLIAFYQFNNNSADSSGNKYNGTIVGNLISVPDRFNKPNSAYKFDGTSYISVPDNNALRLSATDFTINYWVKMDQYSTSSGSMILSKRGAGANNGWSTGITGFGSNISEAGQITFTTASISSPVLISKTYFPISEWHMVTIIYNVKTGVESMYLDGVLNNWSSLNATPNSLSTSPMFIGGDSQGPVVNPNFNAYLLKGTIDDIRIYDRILSPADIDKLIDYTPPKLNNTIDSLKLGLVAFYPFSGTAVDSSGHNHNPSSYVNVSLIPDRFSKPNSAYAFNGSSFMIIPEDSSLRLSNTNFTINYWVKIYQYGGSYGNFVISKRGANQNNGWSAGFAGLLSNISAPGVSTFTTASITVPTLTSLNPVPLNSWHMITITYNKSSLVETMFVDGVLSATQGQTPSPNASTNVDMYIGGDSQGPFVNPNFFAYLFNGGIDDIRIYNRLLSNSDLSKLYTLTY